MSGFLPGILFVKHFYVAATYCYCCTFFLLYEHFTVFSTVDGYLGCFSFEAIYNHAVTFSLVDGWVLMHFVSDVQVPRCENFLSLLIYAHIIF